MTKETKEKSGFTPEKPPSAADNGAASVGEGAVFVAAPAAVVKKGGPIARLKGFLSAKTQAKSEKKKKDEHVAETLNKIDSQLNELSGHSLSLIKEVEVLRESNQKLLEQIAVARRRELISKIAAVSSWIVAAVLIVVRIVDAFLS